MKTIYLLDAVNYLFRSYYAIGPMTNDQGESTSALYGFIRSVQKILKEFAPEHFVAVFDGPENKKSRQALYADYKMHRKEAPADLIPQLKWAYQFCTLAGIPVLCIEGVEADDTIASIAKWAVDKQKANVFICSSDKDLMQLIDDSVQMIHVHKNNLLVDAKQVEVLYGVRPNQMLDLLAIMGDTSDNIPGLPGFGPKTAAALLQEFGSLDEILAHPEKVKGAKKQEVLREQKSLALLSRQLATLETTISIPKEANFYQIQSPDLSELTAFYQRMKFLSLLRDLHVPEESSGPEEEAPTQYELVDNKSSIEALFEKLAEFQEICIDTETTAEHPLLAKLVGIGFCIEPTAAWYIPCNQSVSSEWILQKLSGFLETYQGAIYGHNFKYDWHILKNCGVKLPPISFDTMLASYLLNPQHRKHSLDELALQLFNKGKIAFSDLVGKGKKQISLSDVAVDAVKNYCCENVDYTTRLKLRFEREIAKENLSELLFKIELPLIPVLGEMERRGIYLNATKLKEYGKELIHSLHTLKERIFREAGEEFNINSPQQLSVILFEKLQLKPTGKKLTKPSTGADILEGLSTQHPIAHSILEYRSLEKLRSTYIDSLPLNINPNTGRIHCTYNQSVTATGRLSCQEPNLQNIPVRTPEGLRIRECFEAEKKGWCYVGADYSQIELRLLAHFSKDPNLTRAFKNGEDIHAYTASVVFGIPLEDVTSQMRYQAKAVNFGILYGQGPYGLSQQLGISVRDASAFIKKYFERYPKVSEYIESSKERVRKTGMTETLFGRRRPIPEISNKNPMIRAAAERLAVNTPLQGTAADLIKQAMLEIDATLKSSKLFGFMLLQIHDELIFEVPVEEVSFIESLVKEKMEKGITLRVPIEVTTAVGKNWAEC